MFDPVVAHRKPAHEVGGPSTALQRIARVTAGIREIANNFRADDRTEFRHPWIDPLYAGLTGLSCAAAIARLPFVTTASITTAAAMVGWTRKRISTSGLCCLAGVAGLAYGYSQHPSPAAAASLALGAGALATHALPGSFDNWRFWDRRILRDDAVPYTAYVNGDKCLSGAMVMQCVVAVAQPMRGRSHPVAVLSVAAATVSILMGVACRVGYVRFDPHRLSVQDTAVWFAHNLLLVSVPEEALFRGLIQPALVNALGQSIARQAMALAISSVIFGAAHHAGGRLYVGFASLAGLGYGLTAHLTGRVEAAVALHWLVNVTHFLAFTYPAIDPSKRASRRQRS